MVTQHVESRVTLSTAARTLTSLEGRVRRRKYFKGQPLRRAAPCYTVYDEGNSPGGSQKAQGVVASTWLSNLYMVYRMHVRRYVVAWDLALEIGPKNSSE